jgi:hypothetical protein
MIVEARKSVVVVLNAVPAPVLSVLTNVLSR